MVTLATCSVKVVDLQWMRDRLRTGEEFWWWWSGRSGVPLSPILWLLLCLFDLLHSSSPLNALIGLSFLSQSLTSSEFPFPHHPLSDASWYFSPFFFSLSSFYLSVLPLHLSSGPNHPITAGRNYAWKLIRRSLNNYPLMQLIDFPFQELCFLSPGPPSSLSLSVCLYIYIYI